MQKNRILRQEQVAWRDLTWLQTDSLKVLSKSSMAKLKNSLSRHGFIQPFNVWDDGEQLYILDGHHRRTAMLELEDSGERKFPDTLPANVLDCKDRKEAVEFLLLYSSQYATISDEGMRDFLSLEEMDIELLADEIDIAGFASVAEQLNSKITETEEPEDEKRQNVGIETNTIYNESNTETMKRMADGSIDLVVTSPPYDDLRTYNGYCFDFHEVAKQLYRVVADGGVVVWIVGDASENGSETGTSFEQALFFKSLGFNLHDTMIYQKHNFSNPSTTRYHQIFEYMFVFSKGRPKTFNPIKDRENAGAGKIRKTAPSRNQDGTMNRQSKIVQEADFGMRHNIWKYTTEAVSGHPAPFPLKLAKDCIVSWSNENDIVYDCFSGSGQTSIAAKELNRQYIGSEISAEYHKLSLGRIAEVSVGTSTD